MGTKRRRRALFCVFVATFALFPPPWATAGSASDLPSWATFKPTPGNPGRGTMTVAPTLLDWLGTTLGSAPTVVVTATDASGAKAKCSIVLRPALL